MPRYTGAEDISINRPRQASPRIRSCSLVGGGRVTAIFRDFPAWWPGAGALRAFCAFGFLLLKRSDY